MIRRSRRQRAINAQDHDASLLRISLPARRIARTTSCPVGMKMMEEARTEINTHLSRVKAEKTTVSMQEMYHAIVPWGSNLEKNVLRSSEKSMGLLCGATGLRED